MQVFPWAPVIDGDFIQALPSQLLGQGKINAVRAIQKRRCRVNNQK